MEGETYHAFLIDNFSCPGIHAMENVDEIGDGPGTFNLGLGKGSESHLDD